MDGYRRCALLVAAAGLFALSGANCPQMVRQATAPLPRLLPPSPTLEQVIAVVNGNNAQIVSCSTRDATLSGPGFPTLRASMALERPKRFRLRAETGLTGPELDLGSNDELFWFWVRRNEPPAIYYGRHEEYASRVGAMPLPGPDWIVEAMGITQIDPALPHQGPFALPGDRLEIRTVRETPLGPVTKITILDGRQGWVLEQHAYDASGRLIASSAAAGHRRDPLTNLVVPGRVSIHYPAAQLAVRLDLGNLVVNRISGNPAELWSMPGYGVPVVNLCDPNVPLGAPASVPAVTMLPQRPAAGANRLGQ